MRYFIGNTVWRVSWFLFWPLAKIFGSVRISHRDRNLTQLQGPVILAANHQGIFDPWLISIALPFRTFSRLLPIRPFATEKFDGVSGLLAFLKKTRLVKLIYFLHNVVVVPKEGSLEDKVAPLIDSLKQGHSILIFPEGRLNRHEPEYFRRGVAMLQRETGAPILPLAVRYQKRGFPFYRININVGRAFNIPESEMTNPNLDEAYADGAKYVRKRVMDLYRSPVPAKFRHKLPWPRRHRQADAYQEN